MRFSDLYRVLIAVALGFAAVVVWAETRTWYGPLVAGIAGLALLAISAWKMAWTTKVVVVGTGPRPADIDQALDEAGYAIKNCPGPEARPCPVLAGDPCPIHGDLAAAVVYTSEGYAGPAAPCHQALHVPVLTVEAGSRNGASVGPTGGSVGDELGTDAAVRAVEQLLARTPA